MNRTNGIDGYERELGHSMARERYHRDPLKWIGKWMLGKVVCLVYLAMPLGLYIAYYYIFLPWKDK
jgi:hypothetical protein